MVFFTFHSPLQNLGGTNWVIRVGSNPLAHPENFGLPCERVGRVGRVTSNMLNEQNKTFFAFKFGFSCDLVCLEEIFLIFIDIRK